MLIRNEDIEGVVVEVPEGHRHLRVTVTLRDGTELTLLEAAASNILRAFLAVKTHPTARKVVLKGVDLGGSALLKEGYAAWQLIEQEERENPGSADKQGG